MPEEVIQALSHFVVALIGWWMPGPSRRRRRDKTQTFNRRASDL